MAKRKYCVDGYGKTKKDRNYRMSEYVDIALALELDDVRTDPEFDIARGERLDEINNCLTKAEKLKVDRRIIKVLDNPRAKFASGTKYEYWARGE